MFHTWSLSMEEQFYLVWPAAIKKYLRVSMVVPPMVRLLLINQASNFGLFGAAIAALYADPAAVDRPIFPIAFTPILLGMFAHAMHNEPIPRLLCAALGGRWVPPALLVPAVAVCEIAPAP